MLPIWYRLVPLFGQLLPHDRAKRVIYIRWSSRRSHYASQCELLGNAIFARRDFCGLFRLYARRVAGRRFRGVETSEFFAQALEPDRELGAAELDQLLDLLRPG